MKITPEHAPCATCAKWRYGRCAETNALVPATAGRHCPLFVPVTPAAEPQPKVGEPCRALS